MISMVIENKPRIFAGLAFIALGVFAIGFFNRSTSIQEVQKLLREYKTAKALQKLEALRGNSKHADKQLDTLLFYAFVKAKNFDSAAQILQRIDYFPKSFSKDFAELIEILRANSRTDLLALILPKAIKLDLSEEFFIELTSGVNSVDAEMRILELGLSYNRKAILNRNFDQRKLSEYMLKRYFEITDMYIASSRAEQALQVLKRIDALALLKDDFSKAEYHLSLGLVYKALDKHDLAWDNIQASAKLGNDRAKSMISTLGEKYKPN